MDSFLFIGYRFECSKPKSKACGWNHAIEGVKDIPINKGDTAWRYWNLPNGADVFLWPGNSYYSCPFGHQELWSDLNKITFDLPANHDEIVKKLLADPIHEKLKAKYKKVELKYGIMKGLG